MSTIYFNNNSLSDLEIIVNYCKNLKRKSFFLYGPLGSGKTQFVKSFFNSHRITSPTYQIYNQYLIEGENIYHFDLYRVEKISNEVLLAMIEADLLFVEWSEKLPSDFIKTYFKEACEIYFSNNQVKILYD